MITVLDASAGITIVLEQEGAEVFLDEIGKSETVISSDLYKIEVANVLWKYVRAGELEKETSGQALRMALDLVDEYVDISENNEEALNESIRLGHSTYDMIYYTLARRNGGKILTKDKKLREICVKTGIDVIGCPEN
jgi:predicted nucleic acid-binding protein